MKTLIVLSLAVCAVLAAPSQPLNAPAFYAIPESLIVGGQEGTIENFPYLVSLRRNGNHICGGSAIRDNWVLTAAHCIPTAVHGPITFRSGSTSRLTGGLIHQATRIVNHPQYQVGSAFNNDASIVQVTEPFTFGVIALPAYNSDPATGAVVTVSGWGTMASGGSSPVNLRWVDVFVWSRESCRSAYGAASITESMVCAADAGRDACQGDSGGPLTENNTVVGIVSWGRGCAQAAFPGVYVRVGVPIVHSWITGLVD